MNRRAFVPASSLLPIPVSVPQKFIVALLGLFFSLGLSATGSLRCGGQLIDQGATRADVIATCGEPDYQKEGGVYWFYDQGSQDLVTRIFFVGDKVEFIEDVDAD